MRGVRLWLLSGQLVVCTWSVHVWSAPRGAATGGATAGGAAASGAVMGGAAAGGAASKAGDLEDYYNCGAAVRRRSRGTGTGPDLVRRRVL